MSAYLLTWNPRKWKWSTLESDIKLLQKQGYMRIKWSCGRIGKILSGDKVFLLMQDEGKRGIVGFGRAVSPVFLDESWNSSEKTIGKRKNYVVVEFERLLNPESTILKEDRKILSRGYWCAPGPIGVPPQLAEKLESAWREFLR
jgi:hypothetical protein